MASEGFNPSCGEWNGDIWSYIGGKHPGLFHCPSDEAIVLMPELHKAWATVPVESGIVDVKVHMLMPGQYPCIPNWHCDFVPRDDDKTLRPDLIDPSLEMFMWVDGPPTTEFRDGREVKPREWVKFTQLDEHRGVASTEHCWRTFIRVVPESLLKPAPPEQWLRRHTQVYLDAENFKW